MSTFRFIKKLSLIGIFSGLSSLSFGQSNGFLFQGPESKASAGAGYATSKGASATLYNPADLSAGPNSEILIDLSYLNANYEFAYTGFTPAAVKVQTPVLILGGSWKPTSLITVGATILPIPGGGSKMTINEVPLRLQGNEPGLMDLELSGGRQFGYSASFGLALNLPNTFSLGLRYKSDLGHSNLVALDSESGDTIFSNESHLRSSSFALGLSKKTSLGLYLGLTYQMPTNLKSSGEFTNEGGQSWDVNAKAGEIITGAASFNYKRIQIFGQASMNRGSKSSNSIDPLVASRNLPIDSRDAISFTIGTFAKLSKNHTISVAAGLYPTTVGDGSLADPETGEGELSGISFGNLDAIDRKVVSLGHLTRVKSARLVSSILYQTGSRSVPESSAGYGEYKINIIQATVGVKWDLSK